MSPNPSRRVLTPVEKDQLQKNIEERKHDLNDQKNAPHGEYTPERSEGAQEKRAIGRMERVLAAGQPENLSAGKKAQLERQMRLDEEWLQKNMVPKSHVNLRAGPDVDFRKAVNEMASKEMSPQFAQIAGRWKNARRTLDPSDPNVANLEHIRPDKR